MGVDICTWRTIIGHFHLFSKSSRTRNKKLLGISPLTLLCTTSAIVALNLFACRQMNKVNEECSPGHNKTNDTLITPQLVNVTLSGQTAMLQNNINYHFNGTFHRNLEFRHGGLRTQTILDPITVCGLSFVHINVNGIDVEGRKD